MVPFALLLKALDDINDPRRPQGQRYRLSHLLLYCVLGILSGANSYRSIRTFIRERNDILHELYGVGFRKVPAVNTIRNVIHSLTASHLEETFRRHAQAMLPPPSATDSSEAKRKPAIALDGNPHRRVSTMKRHDSDSHRFSLDHPDLSTNSPSYPEDFTDTRHPPSQAKRGLYRPPRGLYRHDSA